MMSFPLLEEREKLEWYRSLYKGDLVNFQFNKLNMNLKHISFIAFQVLVLLCRFTNCEVVQITQNNIDSYMKNTTVLFLNFYADWCRFSNMLEPIFADAAKAIRGEFPDPAMVTLGKIDCDDQTHVAQRFQVSKYPTLKLVVNGVITKREFRGQRSKDSFLKFIRKQLTSPVVEHTKLNDLSKAIEKSKGTVIAYFKDKNSIEFSNYENVAKQLRDDCKFFLAHGEEFSEQLKFGSNIVFKPANKMIGEDDAMYSADLQNPATLKNWVEQKCIPFIREITFNNAEELTEEGLMFLILFHKSEDQKSLDEFTKAAERELRQYKGYINILRADGHQFQHPLHHLGKSISDLPLVAIDSFKHMYLFPNYQDIHSPGKLTQFIEDLKTGKLHREFHNGPDKTPEPPSINGNLDNSVTQKQITTPPESVFKNLQPSNKRYTVLDEKDEL